MSAGADRAGGGQPRGDHKLHPEQREVGGYELEAAFRPLVDVRRLSLPANERLFLDAALRWAALRTSAAPDTRAFDHYVEF